MDATLRRVLILASFLALAGCARNYDGPKRYPLSGRVTYDGQTVDSGTISFLPLAEGGQRVSGGPIEDGAYSVPEEKGANAGSYRVEIRWAKATGKKRMDADLGVLVEERKEGLPPRFHAKSDLTAEVSDSRTTFDFHLTSK